MPERTLEDWLRWQETLSPVGIDMRLQRVAAVASRLDLKPPRGRVFTVAGTNGKGTTVRLLENLLMAAGLPAAVYTSPHLVRYNERVRFAGVDASDAELIAAFEKVDAARGGEQLTYFEFGTLAAWQFFSSKPAAAWVLEVGLGGRLDAVNVIDPDVAIITTVDLDHQHWLGDTIEAIAAEKAGIMRARRPVIYGDTPVPAAIVRRAAEIGADLRVYDRDFQAQRTADSWTWQGAGQAFAGLPLPVPGDAAQLRNAAAPIAALLACGGIPLSSALLGKGLGGPLPDGRFQRIDLDHQWVLDVAHNPQAARVFAMRVADLPPAADTTVVIGLFADKTLAEFIAALDFDISRWVTCRTADARGQSAETLADALRPLVAGQIISGGEPAEALATAAALTPPGGRIIVCGSFRVVGPALQWLGLY